MTTKQRMSILLDRWPKACTAQGWNKADRDIRLQVISQAVGREITSMNDLDNSADIDQVYAHLGRLADDLDSTAETLPENDAGYRRRLLWLIHKHSHPLGGVPYVLALARSKFHITTGLSIIEDLTTSQLHQLMMTLNARRSKKKNKPAPADGDGFFPSEIAADCPF